MTNMYQRDRLPWNRSMGSINNKCPPLAGKSLRSQLRQRLRAKRHALNSNQQQQAAIAVDKAIFRSGLLTRFKHIAFYLANDGEINPWLLLKRAHRQGKKCYLPVLAPAKQLWFVHYHPGDKLKPNRFGILEPINQKKRRKPWALNLVFLPLVGFDRHGGRLGMGGGFYDRSFSGKICSPAASWPQLVGLAHCCQELEQFSLASWDIPLARIVTDEKVIIVPSKC